MTFAAAKRELWLAQGEKCRVCDQTFELEKLNLDHSHTTGKIRGVICNRCNTVVGLVEREKQRVTDKEVDAARAYIARDLTDNERAIIRKNLEKCYS